MKLILDMHLSVQIARRLREIGHDAFQLRERQLQKLDDSKIVELAVTEGRVVVTFDLDFSAILAATRQTRPSVIQFRIENAKTEVIEALLRSVLKNFESELERGCILSILPDRIRLRWLPLVSDRPTESSENDEP